MIVVAQAITARICRFNTIQRQTAFCFGDESHWMSVINLTCTNAHSKPFTALPLSIFQFACMIINGAVVIVLFFSMYPVKQSIALE